MTKKKRIRWTYQMVKENLEQQGYLLLSNAYKNNIAKLEVQCDKGHTYQVRWNNFSQGYRCPYCAGKIIDFNQVKQAIEQEGYILLSKRYVTAKTKLSVICSKGHQYEVSWDKFRQGCRCPYCAKKKITYKQVKQYVESQDCLLLSKSYKHVHAKIKIQCSRNHQFMVTWGNFQQGSRCPICNESKGEAEVARVLHNHNISFTKQKGLEKGKSPLRLDFYVPSLSLGIEYDGRHHFEPICYGGMSQEKAEEAFKKQKENDQRKNELCEKEGIALIRIPYHTPFEDITNIIKDRVNII